jgi:hypothetical protein
VEAIERAQMIKMKPYLLYGASKASKDFNNLGPDIRNANSLYKFKALLKNAV